jgi:hypothetical protein
VQHGLARLDLVRELMARWREAAREQFRAFQQSRAELFREFGQHFVPVGRNPFATQLQQAAGMRFFGAVPGFQQGGHLPHGVGSAWDWRVDRSDKRTINVTNYFPTVPDALTWSRGVKFELEAMG